MDGDSRQATRQRLAGTAACACFLFQLFLLPVHLVRHDHVGAVPAEEPVAASHVHAHGHSHSHGHGHAHEHHGGHDGERHGESRGDHDPHPLDDHLADLAKPVKTLSLGAFVAAPAPSAPWWADPEAEPRSASDRHDRCPRPPPPRAVAPSRAPPIHA
jgi:hypothetical protein